jgi:uncharacterized protein involved in exopolysaccharide biosynthesis
MKRGGIETTSSTRSSGAADSGSHALQISDDIVETSGKLAETDAAIRTLRDSLESNRKALAHMQKEKAYREDLYGQLADEYETAQSNYEALTRKYQEIPLAVGSRSTELKAIAPAIPSNKPYKPWIALNMILGGLLGFLVSIPLSFLIHHLESVTHTVVGQGAVPLDHGYAESKDQGAGNV